MDTFPIRKTLIKEDTKYLVPFMTLKFVTEFHLTMYSIMACAELNCHWNFVNFTFDKYEFVFDF